MKIKDLPQKAMRLAKKHSPLIFTVLTVGGVVATAVMSSKAALKADKRIREKEAERCEELSVGQKIATALPVYIPTLAVIAATSGCAIESHILNKKQQVALTLAYAALQQRLDRITAFSAPPPPESATSTTTEPDTKKRKPLYYEMSPYSGELMVPVSDTYYSYTFHDDISDSYYTRTIEDVLTALDHIEEIYNRFGEVSINEFLEILDLDLVPYGDSVMWTKREGIEYYGSDLLAFTLYKMTSDDPDTPPYIWIIPTFPPMAM